MDSTLKKYRSSLNKLALCYFAALLSVTLCSITFSPIISGALGTTISSGETAFVSQFISRIFALLVLFPLMGRFLHLHLRDIVGSTKVEPAKLLQYVSVTLGIQGLAYALTSLLQRQIYGSTFSPAEMTVVVLNGYTIISVIRLVLLTPIFEEVLIRGFLLRLIAPYGKMFSIIVTASIFSIGHGNVWQTLTAFSLGLIFAYITLETGTVKYAIILHMAVNAVPVIEEFVGIFSPTLSVILLVAMYAVPGIAGLFFLIKQRSTIKQNLALEADNYISVPNRTRRFFCTPLIILLLLYLLYGYVLSIVNVVASI